MSYAQDKNSAFIDKVYPFLLKNKAMPKGKLVDIEQHSDELSNLLDRWSGIDYFYLYDGKMSSLAVRCQAVKASEGAYRPFNTFSIRKQKDNGVRTEKEKRLEAIRCGLVYPTHTIQAYLADNMKGDVVSVAVIRTVELYSMYDLHPEIIHERRAMTGGDTNLFDYLNWSDIIGKCGIKILHNTINLG